MKIISEGKMNEKQEVKECTQVLRKLFREYKCINTACECVFKPDFNDAEFILSTSNITLPSHCYVDIIMYCPKCNTSVVSMLQPKEKTALQQASVHISAYSAALKALGFYCIHVASDTGAQRFVHK